MAKVVTYRDLVRGFRELGLDPSRPVIAHASLSAFGRVRGGAAVMLGAMSATWESLMMPTFTYKTMLIPESGPQNNGLVYGSSKDLNRMAEVFHPDMPADRLMGIVPETLRRHPQARRSSHPILSFAGINTQEALSAQSLDEPLAPIRKLVEAQGWVVLLGVEHTANTSIHYAERMAGRKTFVRWALTEAGAVECPAFPSCSDGFQALAPYLKDFTRSVPVGPARVQAIPLPDLVDVVYGLLRADPLALLCRRSYCLRCQSVHLEAARSDQRYPFTVNPSRSPRL